MSHVLVQLAINQPINDRLNSSVFRDFRNSARDAEERTASDKPFQTEVTAAEKALPKKSKPNMQKCRNCSRVCVSLCTTVVHNTAQSSSDYLPCYPSAQHQSSDAVYWRRGGWFGRDDGRQAEWYCKQKSIRRVQSSCECVHSLSVLSKLFKRFIRNLMW